MERNLATKQDIKDLHVKPDNLEARMTIKLGSMLAIAITIIAALTKF